jgi:hypothetical protein
VTEIANKIVYSADVLCFQYYIHRKNRRGDSDDEDEEGSGGEEEEEVTTKDDLRELANFERAARLEKVPHTPIISQQQLKQMLVILLCNDSLNQLQQMS